MGIGDWGLGPIPNPQSPKFENFILYSFFINFKLFIFYLFFACFFLSLIKSGKLDL